MSRLFQPRQTGLMLPISDTSRSRAHCTWRSKGVSLYPVATTMGWTHQRTGICLARSIASRYTMTANCDAKHFLFVWTCFAPLTVRGRWQKVCRFRLRLLSFTRFCLLSGEKDAVSLVLFALHGYPFLFTTLVLAYSVMIPEYSLC